MPPPLDMFRACANIGIPLLIFKFLLSVALIQLRPADVSLSGFGSAYSNASTSPLQIQVPPRLYPSTVACIDAHQHLSASSRTIELLVGSPTTVNFATPTAPGLVVQVSARCVDYPESGTDIRQQTSSETSPYSIGVNARISARRSSSPTTGSATLLATATPSTAATPSSSTTTPVAPTDYGFQAQLDAQLRSPAIMHAFYAAFNEMGRGQVANANEVQLTPRGHDDDTQHETYNLVQCEPDNMHEEMDWPGAPQRAHSNHMHLERHDTAFPRRHLLYTPPPLDHQVHTPEFGSLNVFETMYMANSAPLQPGYQGTMASNSQAEEMFPEFYQDDESDAVFAPEAEREGDVTQLPWMQDGQDEGWSPEQQDQPRLPSTYGFQGNRREPIQNRLVRSERVLLMGFANSSLIQPRYDPPVIDPADHMSSEVLPQSMQENEHLPSSALAPRSGFRWTRLPSPVRDRVVELLVCYNAVLKPKSTQSDKIVICLGDGTETLSITDLQILRLVSRSMQNSVFRVLFSRSSFYFEPGLDRKFHPAMRWLNELPRGLGEASSKHLTRVTVKLDFDSGSNRGRLDSATQLLVYLQQIQSLEHLTVIVDGTQMMRAGKKWESYHYRVFAELEKLHGVRNLIIDFSPKLPEMESKLSEAKEKASAKKAAQIAAASKEKEASSSGSGNKRKANKAANGKLTKNRKVE
jgi:hypothetical protein